MQAREARAPRGQTTLVHGETSRVGLTLVQLARREDAPIIATASRAATSCYATSARSRSTTTTRASSSVSVTSHLTRVAERTRVLPDESVQTGAQSNGRDDQRHWSGADDVGRSRSWCLWNVRRPPSPRPGAPTRRDRHYRSTGSGRHAQRLCSDRTSVMTPMNANAAAYT